MPALSFYDVKTRKKFNTDVYTKRTRITNGKGGKRKITFAVAKRNGREVWRVLKNEKA